MKSKSHKARTLAIEVRLRRVGFAVFEGPNRLLEWGIRRWGSDADPVMSVVDRTAPLLALYSPSVVVLKDLGRTNGTDRRNVIMAVKRKLVKNSSEVHMVKRAEVRKAFHQSGNRNKYQIASAIAEMYPDLKGKVPQKRKTWQPERYNAVLFDAIALALAHRSECGSCNNLTISEDA